jgi:hypothetical protein
MQVFVKTFVEGYPEQWNEAGQIIWDVRTRMIRNKAEYNRIHAYIEANPGNWDTDDEHL